MVVALQVLVASLALVSLGVALFALRCALSLRQLADMPAELPDGVGGWPRLTLVIPACNEADTIGEALRSKLSDGYPDLEVVVIDDRSSDGTGDAARAASAGDPRVRVVRVDELPKGWLGKVNALHLGEQAASGEWLLFSDADIRFAPGTMRRAVAFALREERDLVALVPSFDRTSFLLDSALAVFMRVLAQAAPPWLVERSANQVAIGSGSFNLVRRDAWLRTPGFEWLRMETGDDVGLGLMMKLCGMRCAVVGGKGTARVMFHPTLRALYRSMEKNIALDTPFRLTVFGSLIALAGLNEFAPLISVAVGALTDAPWLVALGVLGLAATTAATFFAQWSDEGALLPALGWPIGWPLIAYGMLRSATLSYFRGGAVWRDTFYPTAELHAGARMLSPSARRELAARYSAEEEKRAAASA